MHTVHCRNWSEEGYEHLNHIQFKRMPNRRDYKSYVRSQDIVHFVGCEHTIRSHNFTFTIDNTIYQEVAGLKPKIGANDEVSMISTYIHIFFINFQYINFLFLIQQWCIELIQ